MDGTLPHLNFLKIALRGKDPRTLWVDFLDHYLLWYQKVHIKIFLMRGQNCFWVQWNLVFKLLEHGHFLMNFRFWLLGIELRISISLSSLKNLKFDYALSFYILKKVFSHFFSKKNWVSIKLQGVLCVPSISVEVLGIAKV